MPIPAPAIIFIPDPKQLKQSAHHPSTVIFRADEVIE
jgi:hypothetical protein